MIEIENLYSILQVDSTVDDKEIKKAYVKMVRKYTPEKSPEEFKKIREAYERLINPISRAEYDAFFKYEDEIITHDKIGEEALENEDYKTAIKEYKKILIIEPSLTFAKNKLGLALTYNKQYDEAIVQFKELIKINANNAIFYSNIAYAYKENLEYDKAEEAWLKAYDLDPINDDIILSLSKLYIVKKEYDKAINFLKKCLGKNKDDEFGDFIYYFEMVEVYTFSNDIEKIEKTIDKIEKIIPNEKDTKEDVAWKFGKLAYELYEIKLYTLAEIISERALEIDDSKDEIKELYVDSKNLRKAFDLYSLLTKDEKILPPLKGPIFYYLYADEYEEEELKKYYDQNISAIQSYLGGDFNTVIESIDILKREYSILYNYKKEFYENIYRISQENKNCNNQWNLLKNDTLVINSIQRLIALWLSENLSDEERNKYFNDIMEELKYQRNSNIISSINRVKSNYFELYQLNSDFLDELKSVAIKNNNYIERARSTSNNSSNYKNINNRTKSSSSSNSGCGVIVICAIIGTVIIPGIGFFIGAFIGYLISKK